MGPLGQVGLGLGCRLFCGIERSISGVQQTLSEASQRVGQMIGAVIAQRSRRIRVLPQELFRTIQPPGEFLFACLSVRPDPVHQTMSPSIRRSPMTIILHKGRSSRDSRSRRMRKRPDYLPSRLVLPLALVGDLAQQVVLGPGEVGHLDDQLRPHPVHARQLEP